MTQHDVAASEVSAELLDFDFEPPDYIQPLALVWLFANFDALELIHVQAPN